MTKNQREGLFWMLAASAGYALLPTLVKTLYNNSNFGAIDVATWRFIFAVPVISMVVFFRHRAHSYQPSQKLPILQELILGAVFCVAVLTAFFALERLPASAYLLLYYTYPAIVLLFSLFLGETVRPKDLLALVLILFGVGLSVPDFSFVGAEDNLGIAFVLACAVSSAIYYLLEKRILEDVEDVSGASAYMMLGTLLTLLLLIPVRGLQLPQNSTTLLSLLGIATVATVLPIFAINLSLQKIGASQASMLSTMDLVLSMIAAVILLGEIVFPIQWLGAALIIGGVIVLELQPRHKINIHIHIPHRHKQD